MIHFDAHADTGDIEFGSLWGHGQPMRRLIESGALRGDRFLQIGLRGYWPPPETLDWMAGQQMRSFEMTEIVHRGLRRRADRGVQPSPPTSARASSCRSTSTSATPATPRAPAPRSPAGSRPAQLLDAVRRICLELPVVGVDIVEVSPPYDHADITAALANRVVLEALSAIARKRQDERDGTRWDPSQPLLAGRNGAIPEGHIPQHHHTHETQRPTHRRSRADGHHSEVPHRARSPRDCSSAAPGVTPPAAAPSPSRTPRAAPPSPTWPTPRSPTARPRSTQPLRPRGTGPRRLRATGARSCVRRSSGSPSGPRTSPR